MRPTTILVAYAAVLALVFGAAVGVGHLVGPVGTAATDPHGDMTSGDMTGDDTHTSLEVPR